MQEPPLFLLPSEAEEPLEVPTREPLSLASVAEKPLEAPPLELPAARDEAESPFEEPLPETLCT